MSSEENPQLHPIILDLGSHTFRMGWAGRDFPDIIAPSIYVNVSDYIFESDVIDGLEEIFVQETQTEKFLYGIEALTYQNILKVHEFRKEGNYNVLLKFFLNFYKQLEIDPEYQFQQPLIILAPFFLSDMEKAKLQHIFFKILKFPSILFLSESQAILSTLQKTTGVVVNLGESYSYISTIFHGFTNIMARDVFPIAGKELTDYLSSMLISKKGTGKGLYLDKWITKDIKEKTCLSVLDPENERKRVKEGLSKYNQIINLPDGSNLEINSERFLVTEPIFEPKIIHVDYIGIGEAIANVIKSWDRENWEELIPNIILAGGTSLIPDLNAKLTLEIQKHFPDKLLPLIKVFAVSGREHMAWIGASILYSKNQLGKGWILNPILEGGQNVN